MARRALTTAAVAAIVVLGGCTPSFKGDPVLSQPGGIGATVFVTTQMCIPGPAATHPGCSDATYDGKSGQLLYGIRLTDGFEPPASIVAVGSNGGQLVLARNQSYEDRLRERTTEQPGKPDLHAAGHVWYGYASGNYVHADGPDGTPAQVFTLSFQIGLPEVAGTLHFRQVMGGRATGGSSSVGAGTADPIASCTFSPVSDGNCFLDHRPLPILDPGPAPDDYTSSYAFAARDLKVNPPAAGVAAQPGQTVVVPVSARFNGPAFPTPAKVTATPLAAGDSVSAPTTIAAGGTVAIPVTVKIPLTADEGNHSVDVDVQVPTGGIRRATATIVVGPGPGPAVSRLTLKPNSFRAGKKSTVSYSLPTTASVVFRVERRTRNKRRRVVYKLVKGAIQRPLAAAGPQSFTFKGSIGGKKLSAGRYRLVGKATTRFRVSSAVVRVPFTIKPPPARRRRR